MKKYLFLLLMSVPILYLNCSAFYNVNKPVIEEDSDISSLIPQNIDEYAAEISQFSHEYIDIELIIPQDSTVAVYGAENEMELSIVKLTSSDDAYLLFSDYTMDLESMLESYIDDQSDRKVAWYKKDDGTQVLLWIDNTWLFVLKGSNEYYLDLLYNNFLSDY